MTRRAIVVLVLLASATAALVAAAFVDEIEAAPCDWHGEAGICW